jgi:hypothetical protein
MPYCFWWHDQPLPTKCALGYLTIDVLWESYILKGE